MNYGNKILLTKIIALEDRGKSLSMRSPPHRNQGCLSTLEVKYSSLVFARMSTLVILLLL